MAIIPLIKSTFHRELWTKIRLMWFILWARQLSFGKKCQQFEVEFAKWQGRKDAVFVNSGSSANLALIQSLLNLKILNKGDRVGFSALGWATTVMPLIELGLKPVPIDIEIDTLNVPSWNVPTDIKALFLTNLLGRCGDIDEIVKKCRKNKILLLEDNCEALGTVYKGKKLGNYGFASTFSFYVGHHLSTIEGGMVCTDNKRLAEQLRIVRAHGWDRNLDTRTQNKIRNKYSLNPFYSRYTFYSNGYNLRPTEIAGFIGLIQLKYLDETIKKRESNYLKITGDYSWLADYDVLSNFAIPVICDNQEERDKLIKKCNGKIEVRPIVGGDLTKQPFYPDKVHNPIASFVHERGFYVGNNPDLTDKELETINNIIKE